MNQIKYPKSFSHIGITVPDIKSAVDFYENVMGLELVADQGWTKIYQASQTGFMGLVLGICYIKLKKRLWILILAHAYMDTILMVQLYLANN